jgi:hypothetical protein
MLQAGRSRVLFLMNDEWEVIDSCMLMYGARGSVIG